MNSIENNFMYQVNKLLEEQNKKIDELTRLLNEKEERIKLLENQQITIGFIDGIKSYKYFFKYNNHDDYIDFVFDYDFVDNKLKLWYDYDDVYDVVVFNVNIFNISVNKLRWYVYYDSNESVDFENISDVIYDCLNNFKTRLIFNKRYDFGDDYTNIVDCCEMENGFTVSFNFLMLILLKNIKVFEIIVCSYYPQYNERKTSIRVEELNCTKIKKEQSSEYFKKLRQYLLKYGYNVH
jgi:hypothetical protein